MSVEVCEQFIKAMTLPSKENMTVLCSPGMPQFAASPQQCTDVTFNAVSNAPTAPLFPVGTFLTIVQRNPIWAILQYDPNPSHLVAQYQLLFVSTTGIVGNKNFPVTANSSLGGQSSDSIFLPIAYATAQSVYAPHGLNYYPVTTRDGASWFWLDGDTNNYALVALSVTTTSVASATFELLYYEGVNGAYVPASTSQTSTTSSVFQVPAGSTNLATNLFTPLRGYHTVRMSTGTTNTSASPQFVSVVSGTLYPNSSNSTGNDVMCHLPLPGYYNSLGIAGSLRIMGASILATCIAPAIYRNGDVIVTQQSGSLPWDDVIASNPATYYTTGTSPSLYEMYSWDSGAYGFLKPEDGVGTLQRMPFTDRFERFSNTHYSCLQDSPYTTADYLVAAVVTQSPGTTPSGLGRITYDFFVNYESMTPWISGEVSRLSTNQANDCVDQIARMKQFNENPKHEQLRAMARTAARIVGKAARLAAPHAAKFVAQKLTAFAAQERPVKRQQQVMKVAIPKTATPQPGKVVVQTKAALRRAYKKRNGPRSWKADASANGWGPK